MQRHDNIFKIKNGRRFQFALIKAAHGDKNVLKMFSDNLKFDVSRNVENGDFSLALERAFMWDKSPEKDKFWREVHANVTDYSPPKKATK